MGDEVEGEEPGGIEKKETIQIRLYEKRSSV